MSQHPPSLPEGAQRLQKPLRAGWVHRGLAWAALLLVLAWGFAGWRSPDMLLDMGSLLAMCGLR